MTRPHRFALLLLFLPLGLRAQSVAAGDSILARGDSAGALAAYEAAVSKNLDNAEAHYRAGLLRMARFDARTQRNDFSISEDRRKAEEHFEYAARFQSDSAKYWLAFAKSLRTESVVTVRAQVPRYVGKAVTAARKFGSAVASDAEYQAGRIYWDLYEPLGHGWVFISDVQAISQEALVNAGGYKYALNFLETRVKPLTLKEDPGGTERIQAELHLQAALAANPRNLQAAGLLTVLLVDAERWAEAVDVTRRVVRATPDSGTAWALWGMALARANRWAESQRAFDSALTKMTPRQRSPYDNLGVLMTPAGQSSYDSVYRGSQRAFDTLYWRVAQPLFLSDRNEARTEFYTRITYVNARWSDPLRGYDGWESDRGAVYVRWGPPDVWASLGNERGADMGYTILWLYHPTQMRFLFGMMPTFAHATFSGEFQQFYHESVLAAPVRYDNVPTVKTLDTVDVQVAQFRTEDPARTEVALFSNMPIGRMTRTTVRLQMELQAAAIIKDQQMRDVVLERQNERVMGGDSVQLDRRSWRLSLEPKSYLMRVEARLPVLERAARHAASLDVRSFAGDSLMLSDILLTGRLSPKDSNPSGWKDFIVEPSSGRFEPKAPVSLLWEVYNLKPDSTGTARYKIYVKVTVKDIERPELSDTLGVHIFAWRLLGRIGGLIGDATGLSARGDAAADLSYNRAAQVQPHSRQVEYLTLNLEGAPKATYDVAVAITDLVANRTVISTPRHMTITERPLRR